MKSPSRRSLLQLTGLLGLDIALFGMTDAAEVPSWLLIVGFGLLSLTLYVVVYGLLGAASFYGLIIKRRRPLAVYLTGVISGLVALQSIGELSPRDVLVLLPLAVIGYLYSAYASAARRNLSS